MRKACTLRRGRLDTAIGATAAGPTYAATGAYYTFSADLVEPVGVSVKRAHLKLSSLVSDLLGTGARRMLSAMAEGETDPATPAALADRRLRATPSHLCDALGACAELNAVYRRLLKIVLEELIWQGLTRTAR